MSFLRDYEAWDFEFGACDLFIFEPVKDDELAFTVDYAYSSSL